MTKVEQLEKQIDAARAAIRDIQAVCPHPPFEVEKTPDVVEDDIGKVTAYINRMSCGVCHKRWTEPQ